VSAGESPSRATPASLPAAVPPRGLPGLDPAFSRLLDVPESGSGAVRTWHLLDNGPALAALGTTAVGTIVAVHGNPTWSYLWRRLLSAAVEQAAAGGDAWRVIAPDQLEMGFSERTGTVRPLARRVRDLGDLTDALQLEDPVVSLGHDWGGVVALGWAVDHPDLLAAVLSLNTAVHQPEGYPIPAPLRLALRPGVLDLATRSTPAFLETTLALASPALGPDVKDAFRAPYREPARRSGIRDFVADIPVDERHPSRPELQRIAEGARALGVPSLLLWGPKDPIFSDRYLDDLSDRLGGDVHRFTGAGHLVAEDADYAEAALSWLSRKGPTAAEVAQPGEAATPAEGDAADDPEVVSPPLWSRLDELRESDDVALVELAPSGRAEPRTVSWRLLSRRVRQLAAGLVRSGVRPGDRVSLLVPPGADLTAALYACLRIGAVVVVADAGLGLRGLSRAVVGTWPDHIIGARPGLAAARALGWPGQRISTGELSAPLRRALGVSATFGELLELGRDEILAAEPSAEDIAAILFTSGSTGPAKGVVYTHGRLQALRDVLAVHYGVGVGTGLVAGFAPFALLGPALGARSATPDMDVTAPATLTAPAVAAAVAAVDATVVFLSPAAVANVVATSKSLTPADRTALTGVRTVLSAGAPVDRGLLEGIARLMPNATASTPYGMTEGLLLTDITLDELRSVGDGPGVCVGTPIPGVRIAVAPLDDRGVPSATATARPGAPGEIVVSAAHLKRGYSRLWVTDRDADFRFPDGARGHRTGDVGSFDHGGRLWIEGRLVHVLSTADGVLTPVAPEQRIGRVPGVRRAGLAGVGPLGTQQAVAVVETEPATRRPALAAPQLAARVREAAGVPLAAVLAVPRLPTDIRHNSKIDRARLSRWAERVLSGKRMTAP
jgi:acyl-coenzyme A synthetase/AMP-(fatty) acid ligase/pimeloyl-ACP methyl ester carboxylesterase